MDLSIGYFAASLAVNTAGFGLFLYGKKQGRAPQLLIGLVMMVYPYFITEPWQIWALAGALMAGLHLALRADW